MEARELKSCWACIYQVDGRASSSLINKHSISNVDHIVCLA